MSDVYFIEAMPLDLVSGQRVPVRIAGGGVTQAFRLNSNSYKAGLVSAPKFSASVEFGENGWTGGSSPNATPVIWQPSINADLIAVAGYYWKNAPVTIDAGPDGGPFVRILDGAVGDATISAGALQLSVADLSLTLKKPIVSATFAGTGGLEGDASAEGRVKRRSFGVCRNAEGRLLLAAYSIYEFGDPGQRLNAFTSVKDMGRAGPVTVLTWQGTANATLDALKLAIPPQGGAVAAPSIACARWWTDPAGPLTADIEGELTGGVFVGSALGVTQSLIAAATGPALVSTGPLAAMAGNVSMHIDRADETAATVLDRFLARVGCFWTVRPAGGIDVFEWALTTVAPALQCRFISRERSFEPAKKLVLTYQINHRLHSDAEISAAIRTDDGTLLDDALAAIQLSQAQMTQAIDSALAAAAARGRLFFRAIAPTGEESDVGDTWIDEDGVFYDRVGGGIVVGGFAIVIGGFRPALYWTRSATQPLAATIAIADAAYLGANDAIDQLIGLADDGVLSINEKITKLVPEQARLEAKWIILSENATLLDIDITAATSERAAWLAMLGAITPPWNNISVDSPISRETYNTARDAFDAALYDLDVAVDGYAIGLANTAQARADEAYELANDAIDGVTALADDGILSINEKITKLVPKHAELEARWVALSTLAATLLVSPAVAGAKRTDWHDMLDVLTPAWDDTSADSPVVRATYDTARDDYDAALLALDGAIKSRLGTIAEWSGVIDDGGKPEDGATRNEWKGVYNATATYQKGDGVLFATNIGGDGKGYVRIGAGPTTGISPFDGAAWAIYVDRGAQGTAGAAGASGVDGIDGADGKLIEFVWQRAAAQPAAPTGNGIPAGWSDNPPAGTIPLWMSTVKQELDGTLVPGESWSTPIRHDGPTGATGSTGAAGQSAQTKVIWKTQLAAPAKPAASAAVPAGWVDDPATLTGNLPRWLSVGLKNGGVTNFTWQTPQIAAAADARLWEAIESNGQVAAGQVVTGSLAAEATFKRSNAVLASAYTIPAYSGAPPAALEVAHMRSLTTSVVEVTISGTIASDNDLSGQAFVYYAVRTGGAWGAWQQINTARLGFWPGDAGPQVTDWFFIATSDGNTDEARDISRSFFLPAAVVDLDIKFGLGVAKTGVWAGQTMYLLGGAAIIVREYKR